MRVKLACLFCLLAGIVMTVSGLAQEGHPLTGVWYGDWGPTPTHRNQITVIMQWDGKNVTGIIDPGPDAIPIKVATLDSTKWTVHLEADAKDAAGKPVLFVADGKLENIGSYKRTLTGTWNHGTVKGDFKITRD
jgi:hypothetical protein